MIQLDLKVNSVVRLAVSDLDTSELFHYIVESARFESPNLFHVYARQERNGHYIYPNDDDLPEDEDFEEEGEDIVFDNGVIESLSHLDKETIQGILAKVTQAKEATDKEEKEPEE